MSTIILTGVTRGCGRALAHEFISAGHTVIGCGRSAPDILELKKQYGEPNTFDIVDVTDAQQVEAWASSTLGHHPAPDFLINNAALINTMAPLWKVPSQNFDSVIDVNIKGVANTIRAFVPHMIQQGKGTIVNFSSGWGRSTSPEVAPYCATKWAIEGLTQAMAQELPDGLACVALNPGIINTDMFRSCFPESAGSLPSPETWAKTAAPYILQISSPDNGKPLSVPAPTAG